MAAADTSNPRTFHGAAAISIQDDSGSPLTTAFVFEGEFTWDYTGRTKQGIKNRGRHKSGKPVVIETEDGEVSISMTGVITSYLGSSNTYPWEALTKTGNASAWVSTVDGGAHATRIVYTSLEAGTANVQTLTFNYCTVTSIKVDPKGINGAASMQASLIDHENTPTVA